MKKHRFTLVVEGPDLQDEAAFGALYEAGCDDALVGRVGGVQYLDFDREGDTLADAVFETTEAVESAVPGARVIHLEPDELVTMADIAQRTGRSRESIRLLAEGKCGPGTFPPPAARFKSRSRLWEWSAVAEWIAQELGDGRVAESTQTARFVVAFNAGLALRRAAEQLDDLELRRIRELVG